MRANWLLVIAVIGIYAVTMSDNPWLRAIAALVVGGCVGEVGWRIDQATGRTGAKR